jgi:hypothetical protein
VAAPWFCNRKVGDEPVELTRRESIDRDQEIQAAKAHSDPEQDRPD